MGARIVGPSVQWAPPPRAVGARIVGPRCSMGSSSSGRPGPHRRTPVFNGVVADGVGETFYDARGQGPRRSGPSCRATHSSPGTRCCGRYPEDLTGAGNRLRMFLEQYWGGRGPAPTSAATRDCRMRHAPYRVGPVQGATRGCAACTPRSHRSTPRPGRRTPPGTAGLPEHGGRLDGERSVLTIC